MPRCPDCGNQLTGSEPHCPACGQPTDAPAPLLEPSSARAPHPLPPKNYVTAGWDLFKQYHTGFVGFCLLNLVIQLALNDIPFLGVAASVVVSAPLLMGNFIVSAKLLQGQTPRISRLFHGVSVLCAAPAAFPDSWPLYRHRDGSVDYPGGIPGRGLSLCHVPGG